jgi:flagellar assembly protein FliH
MPVSKEKQDVGRSSVIKVNSAPLRLKIADYKSFLEEIEADNAIGFGVEDLLSEASPEGEVHDMNQPGLSNGSSRSEINRAYEEGFETGKTEAAKVLQAEYEKRVGEVAGSFTSMVSEFSNEIENYNKEFDKAIVALSLAVARRIVAREIQIDEGAVLSRSREAIRKIIGVERVKIHVNPADEEYIREHRNELNKYADSVKEIVIEADTKVERGGCIIESELGNIDARISTQFELIEEAFLEMAK